VPLAADEEDVADRHAEDRRLRHGHRVLRAEAEHEGVERDEQTAAADARRHRQARHHEAEQGGAHELPDLVLEDVRVDGGAVSALGARALRLLLQPAGRVPEPLGHPGAVHLQSTARRQPWKTFGAAI